MKNEQDNHDDPTAHQRRLESQGIPIPTESSIAVSRKRGGDQIDSEDDEPVIRRTFEAELAKNGVGSRMPAVK